MQGLNAIGWYLPAHRLDRAEIGATLEVPAGKGLRVVAGYDEDATTMAVEAVRRLAPTRPTDATVWFATTRPPYLEKTNAAVVAAAVGLRSSGAYDVAGAVRSGFAALRAASGDVGPAVAVLSDVRYGLPGSPEDLGGTDGAVAVGFGDDPIAVVRAAASITEEVTERWRPEGTTGPGSWDPRWGGPVHARLLAEVLDTLRKRSGLTIDRVDHLVVTSPSPRAARAARLDVEASTVVTDGALGPAGAGAAQVGLLLADRLAAAEPGEQILVLQAADGADALLLEATDRVREVTTSPLPVPDGIRVDYARYLTWRGLLPREPVKRPPVEPPAAPAALRNEDWKFAFVGSRCRDCGTAHLPPERVCMSCGATDRMEPAPLQDSRATVRTFTLDHLAATPAPPLAVGVLDFDGGGRYRCELTDVAAGEVRSGLRVEMAFRLVSVAPNGVRNYFWKARPVREEQR
ncbi:MAG TPA: OB-fold domain-containing protein [Acidimicrobiales bacterium]